MVSVQFIQKLKISWVDLVQLSLRSWQQYMVGMVSWLIYLCFVIWEIKIFKESFDFGNYMTREYELLTIEHISDWHRVTIHLHIWRVRLSMATFSLPRFHCSPGTPIYPDQLGRHRQDVFFYQILICFITNVHKGPNKARLYQTERKLGACLMLKSTQLTLRNISLTIEIETRSKVIIKEFCN